MIDDPSTVTETQLRAFANRLRQRIEAERLAGPRHNEHPDDPFQRAVDNELRDMQHLNLAAIGDPPGDPHAAIETLHAQAVERLHELPQTSDMAYYWQGKRDAYKVLLDQVAEQKAQHENLAARGETL